MCDPAFIKVGRALIEADDRAKTTLEDRRLDPVEAEFRATRVRSFADRLAASALEGIMDKNLDQAAWLRSMAQRCWMLEDRETNSSIAGRWHDLGQLLWQASHDLRALVDKN